MENGYAFVLGGCIAVFYGLYGMGIQLFFCISMDTYIGNTLDYRRIFLYTRLYQ